MQEINLHLRASAGIASVSWGHNKLFNLTSNYLEDNRDAFFSCVKKCNLNALLIPAHSLKGNRQDAVITCAAGIHIIQHYCIECLDRRLRVRNKSNMLEESSQISLLKIKVVSCFRSLSIIQCAIIILFWWLASNSCALSKHSWSVWSMGCVVDLIFNSITILAKDPNKLTNESFMMHIFNPLINKLLLQKDFYIIPRTIRYYAI